MTQNRRYATLAPPHDDKFSLLALTGSEALSAPFKFDVTLLCEDPDVQESELLGENMAIKIELQDKGTRYFHGVVAQLVFGGSHGRYFVYKATLCPWVWLLSQSRDCRIFQRTTIPELVEELFREHGFSDYARSLTARYPRHEYIVQYRESTFAFISRLLEQEGIYYFFRHEENRHTLVLADSPAAHNKQAGYETVPFEDGSSKRQFALEYLSSWSAERIVRSGRYAMTTYDFEKPRADLAVEVAMPGDYIHRDHEVYDYPGKYREYDDGERQIRSHAQHAKSTEVIYSGLANTRGLGPGMLFDLSRFPRRALNCEYLVIAASYALEVSEYESHGGSGPKPFSCKLTAIESKNPYVPVRATPCPVISGPQTATVVGKNGDEIWTDEYGRVKLQFHWDRKGKYDENSSCWVRVSQVWAGANWGSIHIPRIGQEVVVEFLDGNPSCPIVTGRVYNRSNMPPYELSRHQTRSGIKSQSTKGGGFDNCNELRFEDLKGEEQLYLQAERNMDTLVKHDQSLNVGNDRSKTITGKETNKVDGGRETAIEKFDNLTVNSANKNTTVHGQFNIVADEHYKIEQNNTQLFMKDRVYVESDGDIELRNGGVRFAAKQAGSLVLRASGDVTLVCGASSISMKADGTITISGTTVKIGTPANNAAYEAIGVTVSGAKISQSAVGVHELGGAIIKIG